MTDAWHVFRKTLGDLWDEMFLLAMANVLWVVLCLLLVTAPKSCNWECVNV